jgi:hypothetical protein
MCHYDHATVPVPAVNVVTLLAPTVFVVAVNPAPTANTFAESYRNTTMPE